MADSKSSTEAHGGVARALAELDHPMNYTNSTFTEQKPANAEERQTYLYDRTMIEDVISDYNYGVDASLVKNHTHKALENLFTNDAEVVFPHGRHQGNLGLREWLLLPVSALHRMSHLSSNHIIKFESSTVAHGRSAWQSSAGLDAADIGQTFSTGGYYYWSFRKVDEKWKISFLFVDLTWTSGAFPITLAR